MLSQLKENRLTKRELDTLIWAARGKTVCETAQILGISEYTARDYAASMINKFNANSKTEAVAKAIVFGILSHNDIMCNGPDQIEQFPVFRK